MTDRAQHSVSVAAVVVNEYGETLVVQRRDNGKWEPPGGVLEVSESVLDGLQREVREETGLLIEPERLTGVYKNMPRGIIALVFRARVRGGGLLITDETTQAAWWDRERVSKHLDQAYAVRILDALDNREPAIRAHDGVRLINALPVLPH